MNNISKAGCRNLIYKVKYNKISWDNGNPYNLRWQYKWKHAYYAYPKDTYEYTRTQKP